MRSVILASQSKQRRALLESLGFEFEVMPADLDELKIDDPDHVKRVAMVAQAKADKISQLRPEAIIIACDTFILLDNQRLEKPLSLDEARQMLKKMSGREVNVLTGWAYIDPQKNVKINGTVKAQVTFRKLRTSEIENYVTHYPVITWAGAFSLIHAPGMALIADIRGSLTAIEGIPIETLIPYLETSGVLV